MPSVYSRSGAQLSLLLQGMAVCDCAWSAWTNSFHAGQAVLIALLEHLERPDTTHGILQVSSHCEGWACGAGCGPVTPPAPEAL